MVGYKQLCRYCDKLIPPNAKVCPMCGKVNPLGPLRCPKCRNPVENGWVACSHCGLSLQVDCPDCGKKTFLGDYCDHCGHRLVVICSNRKCRAEQPLGSETCFKCGQPLK